MSNIYPLKGSDALLTALNESGNLISLVDSSEIPDKQRKMAFYCPACKEPLILKAGEIRIPHFAHKKNSECTTIVSEPESLPHLMGKQHLFTYLKNRGLEVYLEYYLADIKQRPDLLFKQNGEYFVVEYQCSPIPRKLLQSRTEGYLRMGIVPFWIIGGLPYRKQTKKLYTLSDFHWSLAKIKLKEGLTLISYQAETKHFHQLSQITPISSSKVAASLKTYSIYDSKVKNQSSIEKQQWLAIWLEQKGKWLQSKVHYGNFIQDHFLREVYTSSHNPFLLPPICGTPVQYLYFFQSHPIEWQFYIYYDCIVSLKIGQRISLNYVYQRVSDRIRKKHIVVRNFPLDKKINWKMTVKSYFKLLTTKEYFEKVGENLFEIRKKIIPPRNIEEANNMENEFYHQHVKDTLV
ncbi:competence protein CoiA [Bacillus niameyensis]|uniref:competence protein CoiA n=1 Tax=Bacillus niameyensis TaxID=1522308 RepID=UPI000A04B768|nr:competence protein CoiA family protein [Bacillus niameyensis]